MAGLLDWQTEDDRIAQQRALQAYSNQVGQQQQRQEVWDALGQTLPAQIVKSIYQAARLPGDVYQGKVDPRSDEAIGRAADLAGAAITGSMPFAVRGALGSGGGKMVQPQTAEGIRAYHGSPYNFERFDLSKIGAGEGAQTYGHGLYFAEAEPVAKGYRDRLASGTYETKSGRFDPYSELEHMNIRVASNKSIDNALDRARGLLKTQPENAEMIMRDMAKLEAAKAANAQPAKGHMYEVNIRANPEQFLDWDKPLREQSATVRNAFSSLGTPERLAQVRGEDAYRALGETLGSLNWPIDANAATRDAFRSRAAKEASDVLRQSGIPGIRYLDAGSRGAGEGSRNYVVFDDNMIDILRKYGLVGLLGGGAVAAGSDAPKPIKREDIERGLL